MSARKSSLLAAEDKAFHEEERKRNKIEELERIRNETAPE
jgi:adenylate kinase family enzyme